MLYLAPTFDVLFKDFFDTKSPFDFFDNTKIHHPVDVYETDTKLVFEVACTGIPKEDVKVEIDNGTLRISYDKPKTLETTNEMYLTKSISKKSFNLGYKVSSKYDLAKADCKMENGLLTVTVPLSEESNKTKLLTIN